MTSTLDGRRDDYDAQARELFYLTIRGLLGRTHTGTHLRVLLRDVSAQNAPDGAGERAQENYSFPAR